MKLLFLLLLTFITLSNCKLIKRTYTTGTNCNGKITRVDVFSLCSYLHLVQIDVSKITYHQRNTSEPYNCDETSFDSTGVVKNALDCKPFGPESSYSDTIIDGFTTETALSLVPEGTCNDFVYVDTECNTNFYMTSFIKDLCYPSFFETENMTVYLKNSCNKDTFNSSVYTTSDCSGTPVATGPSPYQKRTCERADSKLGKPVDVFHSYSYKEVTGKPSHHNEVDGLDPNNAITIIPSIILIISLLLSLLF